ncbi:NADP-dependent oxidoreductase [Microbacterium invictum]|uniref:Enoyl reductase (ER) domain-containing protein n=1 Tax=Microbacterium invictum TaxID=515415 RepID=A0AA40SLM5_9MICO|nr:MULTISPECIES: NADP-dependent oxidoreductase [Microbacterium]MBB4138417.1 hypothetical protein [Microbacterium invictum]
MPTTSREIRLVHRPDALAQPDDFALVEVHLDELQRGQVLVRNDWMSVDPAMRGRMRDAASYVPPFPLGAAMDAPAVGTVVASRSDTVAEGQVVLHSRGFRDHAVLGEDEVRVIDASLADPEHHLGVLGLTGLTAYVGLTRIARVADGETVFISGAAGAVGVTAARVARHLGASTVIGSAGGPEKVARLTGDLGYDAGFDYRAGPVRRSLKAAAPEGIDVYFDNVGGEHLEAALSSLHVGGRVAMCGAISQYNAERPQPGPTNLSLIVTKRLTMRGFIVLDHYDLFAEWIELASGWLRDGSLPAPMTVVDGLENAPDALLGLFEGRNVGKMLVRLSDPD